MNSIALTPFERQLVQAFPDFRPVAAYSAALPLYRLRIAAKVLVPQRLSTMAQYVLRAVVLGRNTVPLLSYLLGLSEEDIADSCSDLLHADLVVLGQPDTAGNRVLTASAQGMAYLTEHAAVLAPQKRWYDLHYDPLSQQLLSRQETMRPGRAREDGLFVLPHPGAPPVLGTFMPEEVRDAIRADPREETGLDVVALVTMDRPSLEYLPDVRVVLLRHRAVDEERLAVYRGTQLLVSASTSLERLRVRGLTVVPPEITISVRDTHAESGDAEADSPLLMVQTVEQRAHDLAYDLARREYALSTAQDVQTQAHLSTEIARLQRELAAAQAELATVYQTTRTNGNPVAYLRTEEHRAILERAFREARSEVIIISPWMNTRTVDHRLCDLMRDALRRGVHFRIGYGFGSAARPDDERKRLATRAAIQRMRHYAENKQDALEIVDVGGTHEKILVCDRQFAAFGSFNWLSYRGEQDDAYRREISQLMHDSHDIERLAGHALEVFR